MEALFADVKARQKQYGVVISVRAEDMSGMPVTAATTNTTVDAKLRLDVLQSGGATAKSLQSWRFDLVRENGWRVCGAQRTD